MSLFILCYRPRRPVLTVVSCFCLMSSICFSSVFMLSSLLSCVFHCVISCFVSPVCCCPHQVELMSVSSCFVLVMSPSLSSRFTSLSCPRPLLPSCCPLLSSVVLLLSHHHHHCPVMSPLSSRLFHVLCRGLCPLVSSLLLCFVSSSPVCLLSLFCPSSCRPVTVWERHFSPADPRPQQNTY